MFGKKSNNAHDALEARLREMLAFRMTSDSRQEEDDDRPDQRLRPINGGTADPTDDVKSHSLRHSHDDDSDYYYHNDRPHSARVPHTAREVLADTCVGVINSSSSAPSTARGDPSYSHHHNRPPSHERSRLGPAASSKLPPQSSSLHKDKEPAAPSKHNQSKQSPVKRNNKKKELTTVSEVSPLKTIGNTTTGGATGGTTGGTGTVSLQAEPPSFFRALQTEYQSKIKRLQEENSNLRKELDDTKRQLKQQHQLLVKERHDKKLRLAKTLASPDAADTNNNNGNNNNNNNDNKTNAANDDKNNHKTTTLQKLAKVLSPPEKGLIKAERVVVVPSPKKEKK